MITMYIGVPYGKIRLSGSLRSLFQPRTVEKKAVHGNFTSHRRVMEVLRMIP